MPRRPKKGKSSSLLLRNLIKDLNEIETAVLRERIMKIAEMTKSDLKLNSHKYNNGIISPHIIESTMDKTIKGLAYEEPKRTRKSKPEFIIVDTNVSEPEVEEVS
jgi:hypothetical protein